MISTVIEEIRVQILADHDIFGGVRGYVYNPYVDTDVDALSDRELNYFYLVQVENPDGRTYNWETGPVGENIITTELKFIGVFDSVDITKVPRAIQYSLEQVNQGNVIIVDQSMNNELIYKDETGQELRKDMKIVRLDLEVETIITGSDCDDLCLNTC